MHHLGSWVSALADGQLGAAEAERALAHVAACPTCADQLAAARQARRTLSVVADAEPAPDLTARLLALAGEPAPGHPDAARRGQRPAGAARRVPVVPLGSSAYSMPARALTGELGARRSPRVRLAAGSLAGLGVVAASLFLLGAQPVVVPDSEPAQALTTLGGASAPGGTSATAWAPELATRLAASTSSPSAMTSDAAVLAWMRDAGWSSPVGLPDGYAVTGARLVGADREVLELDLEGPHGVIVLTEQAGELDVEALAGAAELTVGDRTVFVLSRQPWHAVWQAGDTVVSVVADGQTDAATELVADFPAAEYDDGLPARLTRGWDTVTGALARP
ncbi:zf-HC2 domain-containing protein [Pengzhenrongella sicca]|uniref:Zf-HC2 domain-containing protein n=1 Tax=Pengzhenrongella sicca TaxID=2819238 RepID=A0A8A4ZGN3_9MICO|nr:zf-HC2 domain-containing protein [Pengzhenrongella sicca]QTE28808.1 zf-HC2 domain-containing protein [Pengzhenrongella sicca]